MHLQSKFSLTSYSIAYSYVHHLNFYFSSQVTCTTMKEMKKVRYHISAEPCHVAGRDTHGYSSKTKQLHLLSKIN